MLCAFTTKTPITPIPKNIETLGFSLTCRSLRQEKEKEQFVVCELLFVIIKMHIILSEARFTMSELNPVHPLILQILIQTFPALRFACTGLSKLYPIRGRLKTLRSIDNALTLHIS
jgi:hypothetical protein